MNIDGTPFRSIWAEDAGAAVGIIDQTELPHRFATRRLDSVADAAEAIRTMRVRGAPLIGATAAWGIALAMAERDDDRALAESCDLLAATRPTAVNLRWALQRMRSALGSVAPGERADAARRLAAAICDEDVAINRAIGEHGLALIRELWSGPLEQRGTLHILTHCNAGWLATVDWGTALAPIYRAHDEGIPLHVWVDETRPRNQGAALTAWELGAHGIDHDVIVDNAGGHLMQRGSVQLCLVGTDRTARNGDVCNKIGTYLKALAAADNGVPFYVALPGPTIDWAMPDGVAGIPIEERDAREVTEVQGCGRDGEAAAVRITPPGTPARNFAFDVTPARLVTGLITERGVCAASEQGLLSLYPEQGGTGHD